MEVSKFKLNSTDIDDFIDFLINELSFDYESHSPNMSLLASEEYYFRNGSAQLNMIVAKKEGDAIFVDVIGGAGGRTILNIDWGSESSYIKRVVKKLRVYSTEQDIEFEEIKMRGTRQPKKKNS